MRVRPFVVHITAFLLIALAAAGCGNDPPPNRSLDTGVLDTSVPDTGTEVDTGPELAGPGEDCEADEDCQFGACKSFGGQTICSTSCESNSDCGSELQCVDGACAPSDYCLDEDGDGYGAGEGCRDTDCADDDAAINPGASELCGDDVDNDCDGAVDEGFSKIGTTCTAGVGACQTTGSWTCRDDGADVTCSVEAGSSSQEICDGLDNDCDGEVDEEKNCTCKQGETQPCYRGSTETRGVGLCADGTQTCGADGTWGKCQGATEPAEETCNGKDDNCSGVADDVDKDGDGFYGCTSVSNYDCDDDDKDVHPGAPEVCNRRDDNCNGLSDEGAGTTYYLDKDGDGWGIEAKRTSGCTPPHNYVEKVGDCNDNNKDIHPTASESCNDTDDDCNGKIDDGLKKVTLYKDNDGDTYGTPNGRTRQKCLYDRDGDGKGDTPPVNWSTNKQDCNDSNVKTFPGAEELCDGILNDCDASVTDWPCSTTCKGSWPKTLASKSERPEVAQLDSDIELELVFSTEHNGKYTVAYNHDGTQLWRSPHGVRRPVFADMNDDNTVDVVVQDGGAVRILDGRNGQVIATIPIKNRTWSWWGDYGTRVFDLDGDGNLDIAPSYTAGVILLNDNLTVSKRVTFSAVGPDALVSWPLLFDFQDDGLPEVLLGSRGDSNHRRCSDNSNDCNGRMYAFELDGSRYNDPHWNDPSKPHFKPHGYPGAQLSMRNRALDVDGDGSIEIASHSNGANFSRWEIWNQDGTRWQGNGDACYRNGSVAAVANDGTLDSTGALSCFEGSPVLDFDGNGVYEHFVEKNGTLKITNADHTYDDSRIPHADNAMVTDLDRDGGAEVFFTDYSSGSTYCYSFPSGTYDTNRILAHQSSSPLARQHYPTGRLDPFEPNDRGPNSFKPKSTTQPRKDSRAFDFTAFRLGRFWNGWRRKFNAIISTPSDVDYYYARSRGARGEFRLRPSTTDLDLKVHMYSDDSQKKYLGTRSSAKAGDGGTESVSCQPHQANNNCPKGSKIFIVEVQPNTPKTDAGPYPYEMEAWWVR